MNEAIFALDGALSELGLMSGSSEDHNYFPPRNEGQAAIHGWLIRLQVNTKPNH